MQSLATLTQSATEQAAETLQETKETIAARLQRLRLRLGLEPLHASTPEHPDGVTR